VSEWHTDLIERYGGAVTIPGIEYGNSWIPADTHDLYGVIGRHWVKNNGNTDSNTNVRNGQQTATSPRIGTGMNQYDRNGSASPGQSPCIGTGMNQYDRNGSASPGQSPRIGTGMNQYDGSGNASPGQSPPDTPKVGESGSVVNVPIEVTDLDYLPAPTGTQDDDPTPSTASSRTDATSVTRSAIAKVHLPNGTEVTVGTLIRLLDRATQHSTSTKEGQFYYFFRGYEGMELWSILFFEDDKEEDVVAFGKMLVARGIIHNYTPNCENFAHTFLVLQPRQEPRVLNTSVKWPKSHTESCKEDPMDVILRVSRQMDEICSQDDYRQNLPLFHDFEEAVAQLQVIEFPKTAVEKVTFALNLFNLVMRHAMLVAENRGWVWPQRLDELEAFLSKIGYNIGGDWLSLAELQASLYGRAGEPTPVLIAKKQKWWRLLSCRGGMEEDLHYASPVFRSDPRILMATTWGTQSSPKVSTLYPNRLEEGLRTAAEIYCQQHVVIGFDQVILPALLSWHRADFGSDPEEVMDFLYPYLSYLQLKQLQDLHESGRVRVVFDDSFGWKRGMSVQQEPKLATQQQSTEQSRRTSSTNGGAGGGGGTLRPVRVSKVRGWLSRQPSCGEGQIFAPTRGVGEITALPYEDTDVTDPTGTNDDNDVDNDVYNDDDDDGHSFFQSVTSEMTYGSEFEDLVPSSSSRVRLQRLQRINL
jgi:hypothetical protein